jgi:5-methylcytosine-specific restriction endonuclease McrBC GTP-binding regulatory subunit McrB
MIREWADWILENGGTRDALSPRQIREGVKSSSAFSDQLHSFETHLKAAAFALLEAQEISCSALQYALIPVGADWTGNENILGYPDGLDASRYVSKPALQVMLNAAAQPDLPHFLILDEMNLSHVERYFADILSAIESGEPIPLYEGPERFLDAERKQPVPGKLTLPDNLFIIGTVNVDETTYMFSPKVLDRANVIEFRMDAAELSRFLEDPQKPNLNDLNGKGAEYGPAFVKASRSPAVSVPVEAKAAFESEMMLLFHVLQEHGAEFGYRVAHEAARFLYFYRELGGFAEADELRATERLGEWFDDAMDAVIVQKLLPKLHGSRSKLEGLLWALGIVCAWDRSALDPTEKDAELLELCKEAGLATEPKYSPESLWKQMEAAERPVRYKRSFDKILRMQRKLERDQFTSFAEA